METNLAKITPTVIPSRDTRPKIGEWYWVKDAENIRAWKKGKPILYNKEQHEIVERLMCVSHLASNHVQFQVPNGNGSADCMSVAYDSLLAATRQEKDWKKIIEKRIAAKQIELQEKVMQMADAVKSASLLPNELEAAPSMLPTVMRQSPEQAKESLLKLKKVTFPAMEKDVEKITQEMVALNRCLFLPMLFEGKRMAKAVEKVEEKLFVLELYAGVKEEAKLIREGTQPPQETPLTIRQMLRYMDEETLIDYDKGGMDYSNLDDFDKWVAKPENLNRIAPELRCLVAFKVRRHHKDYGRCNSIWEAFQQLEKHNANMQTYLLIRNGEQVFRLATGINFEPRLLPFKHEFERPFEEEDSWDSKKSPRQIMPDDFDYDEAVEERKKKIFEANRILFLVQGLLDRSKVFSPHCQINLADFDHIKKYLHLVYDEENGLPSSNPPSWEKYRDALNQTIKVGCYVWCDEVGERIKIYNRFGSYEKPHHSETRPRIAQVVELNRKQKKVVLRWPMGEKIKEEWKLDLTRPVPNKPGYYYQKRVEHNLGMKYGRQTVDMDNCFAVEAYTKGDYKKFLCDAYLKGAYLKWAPQLLSAEKWQMERVAK